MEKRYDPKLIEQKWYDFWTQNGTFHGDSSAGGDPYCIMIPPPNVTGILHMGHALNNTIQDILVRWRKMQGRNVVWMPGTDHAGIATQNVVERALRNEGKSREDLGRDAFIDRVWEWKEEYGSTITRQLRSLGCACDWERERFTMDEGLSDAVTEVFVRLFEKGLIYRAHYIINWCPRCHTALSDEESEHQDLDAHLYYIRYPVLDAQGNADGHIVVATTRPETLLGDVAVAVNPNDDRYADLDSKQIMLPVLNRQLQVIRDEFVDPEFGTGIVKVTPAHDPNDFEMGQRHDLTPINVMNGNGTMNEEAGPYNGIDRFECRKKIMAQLEDEGLVEKVEPHKHAVGHCYRCDTVVEPRLSPQWFVKMQPLAEPAIEAVNSGKVEFVPGRWTKVYLEWMENIRDWCISRQIWWGHRIPIFYCDACDHVWASKTQPESCPECNETKIRQDEDVLDTWFSSWLWPFSTFGWPQNTDDLKFYYPTHDLVTASEIIFFWVARMIMAGYEFIGDIPFQTVYIHGTVRDDTGRKMSKSLGNSIDPLSIIEEFSADALRFSLMMITATGQDVFLSNDKFEIGRNFGTKIWNAARFMQMHTEKTDIPCRFDRELTCNPERLAPDDIYILSRLDKAIAVCNENLQKYRFNDVAHELYEFIWHQFCDWYVEYAKDVLYGDDADRRAQVLGVMHHVFSQAMRLLHPVMPFITEELWHAMQYGDADDSIMLADWPSTQEKLPGVDLDEKLVRYVDDKHDLIRMGRALKSDYNIQAATETNYVLKPATEEATQLIQADINALKSALRAGSITIDTDASPRGMASAVGRLGTMYMDLAGVIDLDAERQRLSEQINKLSADIQRADKKLGNENFVTRAPADVVERQKALRAEMAEKHDKLQQQVATLSQA
ncbi:MAG: valine--tRNA ligase [Kiritimatiellae bacterium]|nr:valine--tRNA ligase [Kiritimatiellia bacterium]